MIRNCPICQRDNRPAPAMAYSQPPWELKRCGQCGFVYLENPPEYTALGSEFAWEKTWAAESARRQRANPILYGAGRALKSFSNRLLKRHKLMSWIGRYMQAGPILDVGCGGGQTLEQLPSQFTPYGIEVSEELSREAAQLYSRRGGRVVNAPATSLAAHFAADFFSGAIMSSFLEHEADVLGVLTAAHRVMRPAARLIVKVPNFACWNRTVRGAKWCGFRFPDHVNYFTPQSLSKALHAGGFRILRFGVFDRFPTSDNMWAMAERI